MSYLAVQFEATVEDDAELQLEKNSEYYWFVGCDEDFADGALTLLTALNQGK